MKTLANPAAMAIWLCLLVFGTILIARYENKPGETGTLIPLSRVETLSQTSSDSSDTFPKIIVFLHPHCPCSRATVEQLHWLINKNPKAVELTMFFFCPSDEAESWAKTELWKASNRIPGAHVIVDRDAATAQQFGAVTSGHTLVYLDQGLPRFSGGVTASRGHEGDCVYLQRIQEIVSDESASPQTTTFRPPVFGCPLYKTDELGSL